MLEEAFEIKKTLEQRWFLTTTASNTWLGKLKKSYGIREKSANSAAGEISREGVNAWMEDYGS